MPQYFDLELIRKSLNHNSKHIQNSIIDMVKFLFNGIQYSKQNTHDSFYFHKEYDICKKLNISHYTFWESLHIIRDKLQLFKTERHGVHGFNHYFLNRPPAK